MLTEIEFNKLSDLGFNRIPLIQESFADLETPLSLYLRLTDNGNKKNSFLLESVVEGERFGRYSFIGLPTQTLIKVTGFGNQTLTQVIKNDKVIESHKDNPLDFIADYQKRFKVALQGNLPRFCGGLVGYFSYDTIRHIEKKLEKTCPYDDLKTPDILLLQTEEVVVIDNLSGKLFFIVHANPQEENSYKKAVDRIKELKASLKNPIKISPIKGNKNDSTQRNFAKKDYLNSVKKAKELIENGEFMQIQIGQRLIKNYDDIPLNFYRALRTLNPSPYMYFYNFGDFQVVGSSPEILVRQEKIKQKNQQENKIIIRPLAGTRPRGADEIQDKINEQDLLNDPKERAEHVMLIDLARNDIGKIAKIGSVKVTESFQIERYSHVMHLVSNVEGILKDDLTNIDVLKASFPAGTLSGAPKIHAMELIDQLEPIKRGIYGGAVGYLSFSGFMDLAIAIRTAIIKDKKLFIQAAAGIVADSIPELEWQETEHKAKALLKASELIEED